MRTTKKTLSVFCLTELTPNLPYAVSEELKMITDAGVPVSCKTMYNQVHFTSAEIEEKNLEEESELNVSNNQNKSFSGEVDYARPSEKRQIKRKTALAKITR